jgi:hypothetical protein
VQGRVSIARDDLRRDRLGAKAQAPERVGLDGGREVRVGADGARDLAPRDLLARGAEVREAAADLARWPASAMPKVVGSAWMPCERPIIGVLRCCSTRPTNAATSASVRTMSESVARTRRSAKLVSSTSLEVMPRWSQRAGGPASSSTCVRNAITSCLVVTSISSMRFASSRSITGRTASAVPAGTIPARSIASHAASSTSSHVRYFVSDDQSCSWSLGV